MLTLFATLASLFSAPAPRSIAQLAAYDLALTLWSLRAKSAARRCGAATQADWTEIASDVEALGDLNNSLRATAIQATQEMRWNDPEAAGVALAHHCGWHFEEWSARMNADLDALHQLARHGAEVVEDLLGDWFVVSRGRVVCRGRDFGDVAREGAQLLSADHGSAGSLAAQVQA